MSTPLDSIDWLTRSKNRITVLDALIEESWERSDLQELTGVSRVTSNRMLAELEDRNWIQPDSHEYEITSTGRLIIEDLNRLLDTTTTGQKLGDIQRYLPVEDIDFDLRKLRDANVHRPSKSDPNGPARRMGTLLSEAAYVRVFVPSAAPIPIRRHRDQVLENEAHDAEAVFTAEAVESALADPEMAAWFQEMIDTGRYQWYRYEGRFPYNVVMADDTVMLTLFDDRSGGGWFHSMIESTDSTVHSWAEQTFERYKREAEPLDASSFKP